MASVEEILTQLRRPRPEQIDEVARIIHRLCEAQSDDAPLYPAVPACLVHDAVEQSWPAELFTELIGSLPEFERAAQPPAEDRVTEFRTEDWAAFR